MAKPVAAWGIDIGQCALKALRCRRHDEDKSRVVAEAFDYIEYPKVLSQPDADPLELIREALTQFLSRNSVRGDKVAISVAGQSGLARFIKLPPVESSKIPDIVKYEAKQQIPFDLSEVVWDYQQMMGGAVEEGFSLETEVGLFAMKRDQVYKALRPFELVDIEVDFIQLSPLALYNFVLFDQLRNLPPPEEYDPDNPPESVVVLSMGTDTTDLVVTNGYRVWQRSVPVGGSHFTKALMKEMKLSFASAEHLKRNAAKAEDPKALFQAMRPVFNDLLTEIQRSLGFFANLDRKAKVSRIVALGNALKLPGLQKYLQQNLGLEVARVEAYRGLSGSGVVESPAFKENLLSYGVSYGLALQGLGVSQIRTNLVPPEILQDRMIRAKKPWAVAAAALLLLGFTGSYFAHWQAWNSARLEGKFETPVRNAMNVVSTAARHREDFEQAKQEFYKRHEVGQSMLQNVQGRGLWPEFLKAFSLCLPRDPAQARPEDITKRNEIKITSFECRRVDDVSQWYAETETVRQKERTAAPAEPDPDNPDAPAPAAAPSGPGWIISVRAHHFHNWQNDAQHQGQQYLRTTLLANLTQDYVPVPPEEQQALGVTRWPVKALGIKDPVIVKEGTIDWNHTVKVPEAGGDEAAGANPLASGEGSGRSITLPKYDFILQFCWQEVPFDTRSRPEDLAALKSAPPAEGM